MATMSATVAGRWLSSTTPVGEQQRLVDVVGDEQDRHFLGLPDRHQQLLHLQPGLGVQGAEWLVHQHHLRLAGQGARQLHTLTHASGQLAGQVVEVARRADLLQARGGRGPEFLSANPA